MILKSRIQYARPSAAQILAAPLVQAGGVLMTLASKFGAVAQPGPATTFTTASFTLAAFELGLLAVLSDKVAGPDAPTFGGSLGGTWTQIDSQVIDSDRTLRFYRSLQGTSRTGTVQITHATTHLMCAYHAIGISGANTGGSNGANAIVQSAKTSITAGTSMAVSGMTAFQSGDNLGVVAAGASVNSAFNNPTAPYAQISQAGNTPPDVRIQTCSAFGANNPSWPSFGIRNAAAIAVEVRAA